MKILSKNTSDHGQEEIVHSTARDQLESIETHQIERIGPNERVGSRRVIIRIGRRATSMLQVARLVLADPVMNQQLVDEARPAEKELLDLIAPQDGEGKARLHVQLIAVVDEAAQEETHE